MAEVNELFRWAGQLGYCTIGISLPPCTPEGIVNRFHALAREHGLEPVSRVDLKPETPNELLQSLRRLRRKYVVVAVECRTKQVARQAAKDHRVDILNFPFTYERSWFDMAEAELASSSNANLEINIVEILQADNTGLLKIFTELRRRLTIAEKSRIGIVVSSGAESAINLRGPRDLIAFINLFGLSLESSKAAVSSYPLEIIKRNKEKLSQSLELGVKLVNVGL
ncbi:MAG: RNase P subunit p30 family protein [Candidatus Bathyarchaeia archaeon]